MNTKLAQTRLLRITSDARCHEVANPAGKLRIDDADSCRLLSPNSGAELGGRRSFNEHNTPCAQQRHDLLPTIHRRIWSDDGEYHVAFLDGRAHLLDSHDHRPGPHAKSDESEQALSDVALHRARHRAQAVDPASPGSGERSPLLATSSEVSSVVSSSMMPMIRSASVGAMPGSFSKSSRSRSMMSFNVR